MHWSWSRVADTAIVVGVLAAGLVEVIAPTSSRQGEGDVTVSAIQVVVVALALWWRRTRPLATVAVVLGGLWVPDVLAVSGLTGPAYVLFYGGLVPILIATFSVARHGRGRTPYVGAALAAATLLYVDLFVELLQDTGEIVFHWSVLTIAWAFGSWQRVMARRAEDSLRRAVEVEVAAAEQARTAVLEERARIARELHDIVAHADERDGGAGRRCRAGGRRRPRPGG